MPNLSHRGSRPCVIPATGHPLGLFASSHQLTMPATTPIPPIQISLREIAGRMGCEIVAVYKDHGISGAASGCRGW